MENTWNSVVKEKKMYKIADLEFRTIEELQAFAMGVYSASYKLQEMDYISKEVVVNQMIKYAHECIQTYLKARDGK